MPHSEEIGVLTEQINQYAMELGVDVVGYSADRKWDTPPPFDSKKIRVYPHSGYKPTELMPSARCVIVLGIRQLIGVMENNLSDAKTTYVYGNFGYVHPNRVMNTVCFKLARWLEKNSWRTLPLGSIIGARYNHKADEDESIIAPLYSVFSMKRSAVLAGLERKARNGLVANPIFGTRIRFGCLITTVPLEGTPLLEGDPCPPKCKICRNVCPTQALTPDGRVNQYRCSSDCGRRGRSLDEIKTQIKLTYPEDLPSVDYTSNDYHSIDGAGNRLCKVACLALCPLGENPPKDLLRKSKDWEIGNPKVELTGFPPSQ